MDVETRMPEDVIGWTGGNCQQELSRLAARVSAARAPTPIPHAAPVPRGGRASRGEADLRRTRCALLKIGAVGSGGLRVVGAGLSYPSTGRP